MTVQFKTFNIQHSTSNIQGTVTGKLGGSALNVEYSMFVREISRRATIWTDSCVGQAFCLSSPAASLPAPLQPGKSP
jgi:hypothetical protein